MWPPVVNDDEVARLIAQAWNEYNPGNSALAAAHNEVSRAASAPGDAAAVEAGGGGPAPGD